MQQPKTEKKLFDDSMVNLNNLVNLNNTIKQPIIIKKGDMFNYALEEYKKGKHVCIHNFANNFSPGLYRYC